MPWFAAWCRSDCHGPLPASIAGLADDCTVCDGLGVDHCGHLEREGKEAMICPFCGKEMKCGIMSGDGRSRVFWKAGDQKASLADRITGVGKVTAAKHRIGVFTMVTYYCDSCKKMIFDTDIGR